MPLPTALIAYFLVADADEPRLVREVRSDEGGGIQNAVEAMLAGPVDPDHTSPWNAETTVLGLEVGRTITLNLSGEARAADVSPLLAEMMMQQLVYTVTEAAGDPDATLTLLIDGEPAGSLWGGVTWAEPVGRANPLEVRAPVQIDAPREGQRFTDPDVAIAGEALLGTSGLTWRVIDLAGEEMASGTIAPGTEATFEPFTVTVSLRLPGYYTLEVSVQEPATGAVVTATRSFSVHLAA